MLRYDWTDCKNLIDGEVLNRKVYNSIQPKKNVLFDFLD